MPRIRAARTPEEAAAVPADQPVAIDLSTPPEPDIKEDEPAAPERAARKPGAESETEPEQSPLQKQLDDMRRAEATVREQLGAERARSEAAMRQARERETELARERGGREQAEYDTVLNAIGHAQAEADVAQRDLETAMSSADFKGAAEAQRRLATATARLVQLEDGKMAADVRREEQKQQVRAPPPPPTNPVDRQIDQMAQLSGRQRDWLKRHPDAMTDPRKNTRLGAAHFDAMDAGHAEDTDGYYQFLEERLGYRKPAPVASEDDDEPDPKPTRRSPPVSAPVSRDAPSLSSSKRPSSRVELSPAQREHAKIAGVDEVTYAKGVQELERRKAAGMYPDRS